MNIPFFAKTRRSADDSSRPAARLFIPKDAAAIAVGADRVATAIATSAAVSGQTVEIVRTGSRGMLWLETLIEVEIGGVRHGFGPIEPQDVDGLVKAGLLRGDASRFPAHPRYLGPVDKIGYLARQTRLTFARCGIIDPLSLDAYRAHGGYKGLARALSLNPGGIADEVAKSGVRGRGGAGFPTGIKWKTVLEAPAEQKYIVCNADEGDSGTFADRMLMEGDPFLLVEGMTIAGLAVGATKGFIYVRSEYPHAIATLNAAIASARKAGLLGADVAASRRVFDLEVRTGAGAYVCGEETALLESLEGRRGVVRPKPPLPAHKGLFGQPTVINNVLSLAAAPFILAEGAKAYADYGMGSSRGTMPIQLAGNLKHGGLFETAFGITLGELVDDIGGGTDVRYGYEGANHVFAKRGGKANDAWMPKDESNPYFTYDPSKCIVCNRCVRACEETQGTFALTIAGRGFDSRVSPGMSEPFLESECVSCGACVQACPTATLTEKAVIEIGQPEHSVVTTCAYCGVGCAFKAEMRGEEVVRMVPYKDGKANRGHSCVKGRFAWGYATHKERILKPMVRDKITDPWRETTWEEAIGRVASAFKRIQRQYGRDAVGGITSSRCTNEETFLVQKLIRAGFGVNNVDTCARVCHSPTGYGLKTAFGTSAGTQDFDSVEHADVILVIGANPTDGHPVFGSRMKKRLREGAKLIVVDPRRIDLVRTPHVQASHHLHVFLPGSTFLEKDGTFTNAERRIERVRRAMSPLNGYADWEITQLIAQAVGLKWNYSHPSQIMDEIAQLTPTFTGVSYAKLDELGSVQWPCNAANPMGSPVMHATAFTRGKGKLMLTEYVPTDERTGPRYPLLLTTGRILSQYNVGAQTRRTANVVWHEEDRLEIHPHDAEQRGVKDGDWVRIASRAGETALSNGPTNYQEDYEAFARSSRRIVPAEAAE
jgi:NADH:ubiquinone oxidoreductase subunit F (NADH-binding)